MTVELQHPYEQMAELIMYAKGATSIEAVLERALDALHSGLTEEESRAGLAKMVQAGFDSGISEGNPLQELIDELQADIRTQAERAA